LFNAPPIEWEKDQENGPLPPANATSRQDRKGASWLRNR
jgi:hypothetical protein